jgi:hypothetical protein
VDGVEQRLLAVDDVKQKDGEEERMGGAESEEEKYEVNDVVDNLRVRANLSDAPLECPGVTDNFDWRRVIGVVLQCRITTDSVHWRRFHHGGQFFVVLRQLVAQNVNVVADLFGTGRLFSTDQFLLVIGFAGNVHQLARIHVVQDPFCVLAVATTLHDGQQQLGGVVF